MVMDEETLWTLKMLSTGKISARSAERILKALEFLRKIEEKKGLILVPKKDLSETEVFDAAIEAGALDINEEGDFYEIQTKNTDLHKVHKALIDNNIPVEQFEITYLPQATKKVEGKDAKKILKLFSELEDHDDVQGVYSNFDIPDEILAQMSAES